MVKWNPADHPRGPIGRFIDGGGLQPSGNRTSDRYRSAQRATLVGDYEDAGSVDSAYNRGSLWSGTSVRKLPEHQREALEDYVYSADANGALRRNHFGIWPINETNMRPVRALDEAIEANHLTKDTLVYRGVGRSVTEGAGPGDQIHDAGFSSTSVNPAVAQGFGEDILEIELPAGTAVAPASKVNTYQFGPQVELVVGRGAVYEIDEVDETGDKRVIRARLVGYLEGPK